MRRMQEKDRLVLGGLLSNTPANYPVVCAVGPNPLLADAGGLLKSPAAPQLAFVEVSYDKLWEGCMWERLEAMGVEGGCVCCVGCVVVSCAGMRVAGEEMGSVCSPPSYAVCAPL